MSGKLGNLFIISAASGTGKTSLVQALVERMPGLHVSVSHTTRSKRANEQDGVDYHFIATDKFKSLIDAGEFLEYAQVFEHYYGTSRSWVEQQLTTGKDIILEIDWQGARQIRKQITNSVNIFILPPSCASLEARLIGRGESEDTVAMRMQGAKNEISHYNEYDFLLVNDDFVETLANLTVIFEAMKHGYAQQKDYFDDIAKQLLNDSGN